MIVMGSECLEREVVSISGGSERDIVGVKGPGGLLSVMVGVTLVKTL